MYLTLKLIEIICRCPFCRWKLHFNVIDVKDIGMSLMLCMDTNYSRLHQDNSRLSFATPLFHSQVAHPLTPPLLLSCPQIVTARIMTSQLPCFVGGLSKKKQTLTTKRYKKSPQNSLPLWLNKSTLFFYNFRILQVRLVCQLLRRDLRVVGLCLCSQTQSSCPLFCWIHHTLSWTQRNSKSQVSSSG